MVLREAVERRICVSENQPAVYCDVPLGLYIVRGDSMVLSGRVSDVMMSNNMQEVDLEEFEQRQQVVSDAPITEWDFDMDLQA